MPNDVVTLNALRMELNFRLKNARVDKVFMPEKDEILLHLRAGGENLRLVVSCNSQNPRIHLSNTKKENPVTAPTFCMLCRKHQVGGVIEEIQLLNNDRIFNIVISNKNEMGDIVNSHIIFEFMGRYSNILLCDSKLKILDAIKRVSFDAAAKRCILPSATYSPPAYNKVPHNDKAKLVEYFNTYSSWLNENQPSLPKFFVSGIAGISHDTANSIINYAGISETESTLQSTKVEALANAFLIYSDIFDTKIYSPCVSVNDKGVAQDYFVYKPKKQSMPCRSLSDAITLCLETKDTDNRHQEHTKHLQSAVKKMCSRNQNTRRRAEEKLLECEKADEYRVFGDILTSNFFKVKKGDPSLTASNFYDEKCNDITIPLNIQLTPQQNAQAFYKKFAKLKRTKEMLEKQINETIQTLEYLASIEAGIATCITKEDFAEIEAELSSIGALPRKKENVKKKKVTPSPYRYEINGFTYLLGKNNFQNDILTFKTARGGDIWFHTKNTHGSHGVLLVENNEKPDEKILLLCAEIAAFYSKASEDDKTECDYTYKKFVKKHPSQALGMATYTNQTTLIVKPAKHGELIK